MNSVGLAHRALAAVWRFHFRIPELAYLSVLVLSVCALLTEAPPNGLFWLLLIGLTGQGVARWEWHKRRSTFLVLARPSPPPGKPEVSTRVQEVILASLADKLPATANALIHPIPVVVGPADRDFAVRLQRRLGTLLLMYGRIEEGADRSWSVFARVVQPAPTRVMHADWFTRELIPAKTRWAELVERLTPSEYIEVEEYPLEFALELESIVRGIAGQLCVFVGDYPRAERLLNEALARAPHSTSHQIDQLRAALARAVFEQGRERDALDMLRARARGVDPSPDLLRTLAELLGPQPGTPGQGHEADPGVLAERLAVLRQAAAYEADAQHDQTLYNLAMALAGSPEEGAAAEQREIVDRLLASSSHYRRTWYLKRERGARAWYDAQQAREQGAEEIALAHFRTAARWYSSALRARPRIRFLQWERNRRYLVRVYRQSPQMLSNAMDAHREAGHRLRSAWLERRFLLSRRLMLRTAHRRLRRHDWRASYAYFDWAVVGINDLVEIEARVHRAVLMQQLEWEESAEAEWAAVFEAEPLSLLVRAYLAENHPLPQGVPGVEPSSFDDACRILFEMGVLEADPARS